MNVLRKVRRIVTLVQKLRYHQAECRTSSKYRSTGRIGPNRLCAVIVWFVHRYNPWGPTARAYAIVPFTSDGWPDGGDPNSGTVTTGVYVNVVLL